MALFSATAPTNFSHKPTPIPSPLNSSITTPKTTRTLAPHCSSNPTTIISTASLNNPPPVVKKKRNRYRKLYPGEAIGITEEMRFVAMRLRNVKGVYTHKKSRGSRSSGSGSESKVEGLESEEEKRENGNEEEQEEEKEERQSEDSVQTWVPSIKGLLKYLVDSQLVFDTVERIVDESSDVAYAYFRKTGLERSESLLRDLEYFAQQNLTIPKQSSPGITYSKYLEELAEKSAPLFLSHFYNIYFSHITGGQVIVNKASENILEGRQLEFCHWEGDVTESFKGVREKLNMLGEHWSRDVKNKCLKETTKSFRFMGQMVRLIIL